MTPARLFFPAFSVLLLATASAVTPPDQIKVPAGFKVELLKEAGPRDGSWISMTADDAGRLYISPQGSIPETGFAKDSKWGGLVRATVGEKGVEKWEHVPVPVGDAMGMLWAFDSLYVSGQGPEGRGIYRCKDTDGDSIPDTAVIWKKVPGGAGEHGAHALILGPDKKSIYIVHGNSTGIVEGLSPDSPYRNWGEDDLLPRVKDPVATFFDKVKAPYGCVYRTDENGSKWELMAGGFRNPYDIAFNADGELFTYDSDMEWDRGLPWYRPTRVLHVVPGGEYGFREGSSKWPDWYPDSLPPVCDIGVGCPTGVKFGTEAKGWPTQYRSAFFMCDWTYGRLLAVHMHEKGASYTATNPLKSYTYPKDAEASGDVEVFLSGKALPLTDVEFGKDGAMYLTVGGRGTQAGLYRVSVEGKGEPEKSQEVAPSPGAVARKQLHLLDGSKPVDVSNPKEFAQALGEMTGGKDVLGDFFMRIFVETPSNYPLMVSPSLNEPTPSIALPMLMSLSRVGEAKTQAEILQALTKFPLASLSDSLKLLKLRVLEISFARQGRPSEQWVKTGLEKLLAHYPSTGDSASKLNRELSQLLIWLSNPELGDTNPVEPPVVPDALVPGSHTGELAPVPNPGATIHAGRKGADFQAELGRQIIDKTLALLDAAPTPEEQIYYALCLRWGYGWTPEQRAHYFRWFDEKASRYTGGNSFAKFVDKIRTDALSRVPESERAALTQNHPVNPGTAVAVPTRAFVKAWTQRDLEAALDALKTRKPDLARGQQLYTDAQCARCHLFRDRGGNVGPDLSAVAQRFGRKDILESILDPNKVVSDQYAMITLTVKKFNGGGEEQVSGLIQEETSATITLLTDPLAGKTSNFYTNVVVKREKANVSIMPPGLLYTLSAEEVADLLAYLGNTGK